MATDTFTFLSIPTPISWLNEPVFVGIDPQGSALRIGAGPQTDWFIDPAGGEPKTNAPIALFAPPDPICRMSAKITVDFAATYDAGVLFIFADRTHWAKLCFEYSPQHRPSVVSVVTRGTSDDCNSLTLPDNSVFLRIYRQGQIFAFHASADGNFWQLIRYFGLDTEGEIRFGFLVQSPTGSGVIADFSSVRYQKHKLEDLRGGE
jgi:regulation of enolase protein 1 (concanavalin A-like superfamily)